MTGFYDIIKKIKDTLQAEPFVNTVSIGNIDDVDLNKQSIFPLSHIIVNNTTLNEKTINFNISVLFMDVVDISKAESTNKFIGNDNEQYESKQKVKYLVTTLYGAVQYLLC